MDIPKPFGNTSELNLVWNWTEWLEDRGVLIASTSFPPVYGVSATSIAISDDFKQVSASIKLTTTFPVGTRLRIPCEIVTDETPPEKETRSLYIVIEPR